MRRCGVRGQTATILVTAIAAVLIVSMSTVNVGTVALTRTQTSNAADAGALAAASWVASAQNAVALTQAKGMWKVYTLFRAIFMIPFHKPWEPVVVWIMYAEMQAYRANAAREVLAAGWETAHHAAFETALSNLNIDDPTDAYEQKLDELSATFEAVRKARTTPADGTVDDNQDMISAEMPTSFEFEWDRHPDDVDDPDGKQGKQTVTIEIEFSSDAPQFKTTKGPPPAWIWLPPSPFFSIPVPGWVFRQSLAVDLPWILPAVGFPILWIEVWARSLPMPLPPLPIGTSKPKDILNGEGEITVKVTRTSQDADLRLFQTKYPEEVCSSATAKYDKAKVTRSPRDRSTPRLVKVDDGC